MTCVIKDGNEFYLLLFLEEALFLKETCDEKITLEKILVSEKEFISLLILKD